MHAPRSHAATSRSRPVWERLLIPESFECELPPRESQSSSINSCVSSSSNRVTSRTSSRATFSIRCSHECSRMIGDIDLLSADSISSTSSNTVICGSGFCCPIPLHRCQISAIAQARIFRSEPKGKYYLHKINVSSYQFSLKILISIYFYNKFWSLMFLQSTHIDKSGLDRFRPASDAIA